MTPDILLSGSCAEKGIQSTFNAFYKAQKEGFRLQEVFNAKLAQRRRMKKGSSDNSSTSSFTSESSLKSGPTTPQAINSISSVDLKNIDENSNKNLKSDFEIKNNNAFNFGKNRVTEFLLTMSSNPVDPSIALPSRSVSARTSESSKCDSRISDTIRESTSSSGIVISDKNSVESKTGRKKRRKKIYVQTRQSERIRRIRLETDEEPVVFYSLPNRTRKRKIKETPQEVYAYPHHGIRKQVIPSSVSKRGRR
ncbi:hypothetical protein NQ317_018585 [Molorchus minor]|uniref:Uncharacterized protein n=1 Tax=Molorchus minor TaxID=1323400 RepID=A0ABQ9IZL0_9CUCU|nr:hypothetical protein NQ317_018585 [Molorchus minor]